MKAFILTISFLWAIQAQAQNFLPDVGTFSCQHRKHQMGNAQKSLAGQGRSDTIDVAHYNITLDISDLASREIHGNCELKVVSKINSLTKIDLDLKALTVDSVTVNGTIRTFTQVGELLSITTPALAVGDTALVKVYYGGQPVTDPSGFGGFYMTNDYAYNIGVGFADDPHNYGRVWFPCIDNFVSRSTYEMHITTAPNHKAFCSGLLLDSTSTGGKMLWHWRLDETIPTYLASVAVAGYTSIEYTYNGIERDFPVVLAVRPVDSARISLVFANLPDAIEAFEANFGPQPFSRVGFAMVPFNAGAMEHATNIAFPAGSQPNIGSELLMAHELGHHWFGDYVTCETAEDMWLNEGWASYCEKIYLEHVYGKEAYTKEVRSNHSDVMRLTHVRDGGYYPISGIGHSLTYSSHVYDKGADVAHTLRGYMGDSLFFDCVGSYLSAFSFSHASSVDFRDYLSNCSGINLTSFFNDWVFGTGFTHFSIDTVEVLSTTVSEHNVTITIRQTLKEATNFYEDVPLDVTYFGEFGEQAHRRVIMGDECGSYTTNLPFVPVYVALDMDEKISDAITDKHMVINTTGTYDFEEARVTVDVTQLLFDSAFVRIENHWVKPLVWNTLPANLHPSPDRYYTIDGVWPMGFEASATIQYNGSNSTSLGYFDNALFANGEDSLVVLYRPYGKADWVVYADAQVASGNLNDKRGSVTLNNLKPGDYVLARYEEAMPAEPALPVDVPCRELGVAIKEVSPTQHFAIYPNPTTDTFTIALNSGVNQPVKVDVLDMTGKTFITKKIASSSYNPVEISTRNWPNGTYLVKVTMANHQVHTQKLIKSE